MNIRSALACLSLPTRSIALSMALWAPAHAQAPADAQAQSTEPRLAADVLEKASALLHHAAQAGAPRGARIVALPGALDARLKLAPCAQVQPFLPAGVSISGAAGVAGKTRVGLRCVQGPVAWQVFLPVTLQIWAPAVVAQAPLPAGARLEGSQLALAVVDWAAAPGAPQAEMAALEGRVLARPVAAGQALRPSDLRTRQWFASGDTVQFVAQGRGFAVSAEGQAMAAGLEGQPVRVRMESGRVVVGLPVGQRRVELLL